ncbi:MAG: ATP-binding protein [Pseudomonadota bacterium]
MARGLQKENTAAANRESDRALARTRALVKANTRLADQLAAMEEQNRLLEASLGALDHGICMFDNERQLVACNAAFATLASCPAKQLAPGTPLAAVETAIVGQDDHKSDEQAIARRLRRGGDRIVDFARRVTPAGGWVLTLSDVTEQEESAEALRRSNRELEHFASVASHELQEPLRIVTGYCDLLHRRYRRQIDDDADQFIGFALDGARRMRGLIDDLLAYARIGFAADAKGAVECDQVVDQALANLGAALDDSLAQVLRDSLPRVHADRGQLIQLFQNLIGNALKYRGAARPLVQIGADLENGRWIFVVSDNGIGIDPSHAEQVFELFKRLHTRNAYPGTGIGLAICKRIVEAHGGKIWLDTTFTGGSRFCFTLPASP